MRVIYVCQTLLTKHEIYVWIARRVFHSLIHTYHKQSCPPLSFRINPALLRPLSALFPFLDSFNELLLPLQSYDSKKPCVLQFISVFYFISLHDPRKTRFPRTLEWKPCYLSLSSLWDISERAGTCLSPRFQFLVPGARLNPPHPPPSFSILWTIDHFFRFRNMFAMRLKACYSPLTCPPSISLTPKPHHHSDGRPSHALIFQISYRNKMFLLMISPLPVSAFGFHDIPADRALFTCNLFYFCCPQTNSGPWDSSSFH